MNTSKVTIEIEMENKFSEVREAPIGKTNVKVWGKDKSMARNALLAALAEIAMQEVEEKIETLNTPFGIEDFYFNSIGDCIIDLKLAAQCVALRRDIDPKIILTKLDVIDD